MPHKDYSKIAQEREEFKITTATGQEVTLPPVLPAKVMMDFMNSQDVDMEDEEQATEVGFKVVENIIGTEQWDTIMAGISLQDIPDLIKDIFAYYGMGTSSDAENEDSDEEGKGEEANEEGASPLSESSSSSEPSTPTSNGSTRILEDDSGTEPLIGEFSSPG